jgi:hypothetical protein
MPQLDKLTFTSQIFWFFLFFLFLYYFFIQIVVLRIKFSLGLKRFFLQNDKNSSFYDLVKMFKVDSRENLLFFFSNSNSLVETKNIFSYYISKVIVLFTSFFSKEEANTLVSNDDYFFVLEFDKTYYSNIYNQLQRNKNLEIKEFTIVTKNILFFYEKFNNLIGFFFKMVQFYIYEVNFVLFYYFFNVFFKFRSVLYYIKLLNKI